MQRTQRRIFVGNLPPKVTQDDIKERFLDYGNIVSIEIKHRKAITQNCSPVFSFVHIEIDERTLNKCFREFSDYDWDGYNVKLELAKESFLERLKRERAEANNETKETSKPIQEPKPISYIAPVDPSVYKKTYCSSSSESEESSSEEDIKTSKLNKTNSETTEEIKHTEKPEQLDYVIKNNKFRYSNGKSLIIESVSDKVVPSSETKPKKEEIKDEKSILAEEKRKKSLLLMKHAYNQQKFAIKAALSNVDSKRSNKIIFDQDISEDNTKNKRKNASNLNKHDVDSVNKKQKLSLFNEDEEILGEDSIDFGVKKQFEGEEGQKLLQLQSRFKNDKRFTLDSRFIHEKEEQIYDGPPLDDEKYKQLEILESVLDRKIINKKPKETNDKDTQNYRKTMLRFDPSKPEHSKFEIKESCEPKEKKKKLKEKKQEENVEESKVEVSKETFYKVTDNLKESLQEKQSFSLLSMFGRAEEKEETVEQSNEMKDINKSNKLNVGNPFKYDSSDSEDDEPEPSDKLKSTITTKPIMNMFKRETFFFQNNDDRLQETFEFLKKLGSEVKQPFEEKRRELKKIVRDKIKNNMRNHRPFRKKLGRHKMIKVKKAKKK